MKISNMLVTGSKGFIGKHMCRRLTEIGINFVADYSSDRMNGLDVTDFDQLNSIDNVELITHLASKTSIKNSITNPYETYNINLLGTLNLLEYARLKNVKKFIYVSTYVYGQPKYLPLDEKHPVCPHSPYNKSKLLAEQLCKNYSEDFGIDVVTLRPFHVYGPGARPDSFIPAVTQQIKKDRTVILSGQNTRRDFLFISDFVNLLVSILDRFPSGHNLYNVGHGISYSLEEVAMTISKLLDRKITISYNEKIRPNDVIDMKADISKVSKAFDWEPKVRIDEGLNLTVKNLDC